MLRLTKDKAGVLAESLLVGASCLSVCLSGSPFVLPVPHSLLHHLLHEAPFILLDLSPDVHPQFIPCGEDHRPSASPSVSLFVSLVFWSDQRSLLLHLPAPQDFPRLRFLVFSLPSFGFYFSNKTVFFYSLVFCSCKTARL